MGVSTLGEGALREGALLFNVGRAASCPLSQHYPVYGRQVEAHKRAFPGRSPQGQNVSQQEYNKSEGKLQGYNILDNSSYKAWKQFYLIRIFDKYTHTVTRDCLHNPHSSGPHMLLSVRLQAALQTYAKLQPTPSNTSFEPPQSKISHPLPNSFPPSAPPVDL